MRRKVWTRGDSGLRSYLIVSASNFRRGELSSSVRSNCIAIRSVIGCKQVNTTYSRILTRDASNMSDRDPDRFTLRQADAAREDYAQLMEELDLVKWQLARLPTRKDLARTALMVSFTAAGRARHHLVRSVLAALPVS
jgi:hypothetical protein